MGHQWPYCQIQIKSARHGSSIVKFKEKKINLQQGLLNFPATHSSSTLQSYPEAPQANFFLRISAKILSISKNFCQNSTPKST